MHEPKPHVSPALSHLCRGVTLSALVVAACAVVQMLVFGFVHFTQVRYAEPPQGGDRQAFSVVVGAPAKPGTVRASTAVSAGERNGEPPAQTPPPPPPRLLSGWDASLHVMSDMAVTAGVIATFALTVLVGLGVVIAAGGVVPGVDRAASAMQWTLLLALACVPWRDLLLAVPFPGVFGSYDDMVGLSQAVDAGLAGTPRLLIMYLLMPLAAFGAAVVALLRFRDGVAQGVIVTSVNDLDERLEREISGIRSRGVIAAGLPRAVGALNQAIGDAPAAPRAAETPEPAPAGILPQRAPEAAEPKTGRGWLNRRERRIGQPDMGEGLRRPL